MLISRMIAKMTAVFATVFGLILMTAGNAAAATGVWRAYGNTNPITSSSSTWVCNSTVAIADDVNAQVCAVRSASGSGVQGAVIVRNNRSSLFATDAHIYVHDTGPFQLGEWHCPTSGVGANSWSVCFGQTLNHSGPVAAAGRANFTGLGMSQYV